MLRVDGELKLDGMNPVARRLEVARRIAYVPQIAPHLAASVREIVRAVCTLRDGDPALVTSRADALELDLTPLNPLPFQSLSGGMKQKLLIALAFASGASLYILDEPTASLDVRSRARFGALLEEVTEGATVLLCSHRTDEVLRFTERVVELGEGRIVTDERHVRRPS
jgi:ABC-2 type transport system ATP-binding protein